MVVRGIACALRRVPLGDGTANRGGFLMVSYVPAVSLVKQPRGLVKHLQDIILVRQPRGEARGNLKGVATAGIGKATARVDVWGTLKG